MLTIIRALALCIVFAINGLQTYCLAQSGVPTPSLQDLDPSIQNALTLDYFPLEVGNTWIYSDGVDAFTVQVLREIRGNNRPKYFEISNYFTNDSVEVRKIRRGPLGQVLEHKPGGEDFLWYRFRPSRGSWIFKTNGNIPCITGSSVKIGGFGETLESPVGSFKRVMRLDFSSPCMDAGIEHEYFVAGIGLVQRVFTTIAGPRTFKLVYARIGSRELQAAPYGVRVSMDRPIYANNLMPPIANPWPKARVVLVVQNHTDIPVKFQFPTSQRFDFIVRDAEGQEVLRWSDGRSFLQVVGEETLLRESLVFPAEIILRSRNGGVLPAGHYSLAGYLTTRGAEAGIMGMLGMVTFEIRDLH